MFLSIINECNECEKDFGLIDLNNLTHIIKQSKVLNFDCLAFISVDVTTIFNQLQMREILKELNILRQTKANKTLLNNIQKAIEFGLTDNYMYLKFEI